MSDPSAAIPRKQILATRTGLNTGPDTASTPSYVSTTNHWRHNFPGGADLVQGVLAGFSSYISTVTETVHPEGLYEASGAVLVSGGQNFAPKEIVTLPVTSPGRAVQIQVLKHDGTGTGGQTGQATGAILTWKIYEPGSQIVAPTNPAAQASTTGAGTGASFNVQYKSNLAYLARMSIDEAFTSGNAPKQLGTTNPVTGTQYRDIKVPCADIITTDLEPVNIAIGADGGSRIWTIGTQGVYQGRYAHGSNGEISATGDTTLADNTQSGSTTANASGTYTAGYQPFAIIGIPKRRVKCGIIIGDSKATPFTTVFGTYYGSRYIENALGNNFPVINMAKGGDSLNRWVGLAVSGNANQANAGGTFRCRRQAIRNLVRRERCRVDFAIVNLGCNDFLLDSQPVAQVLAWKLQLALELKAIGIASVIFTTIDPIVNSTDGLATDGSSGTNNQTQTSQSPLIINHNQLLRAAGGVQAYGGDALIDGQSTVERVIDSGYWLANASSDAGPYVHPSAPYDLLKAAAVAAALIQFINAAPHGTVH